MFSGGGYGQKQDASVDFPVDSLDLSKHVIGKEAGKAGIDLTYDLYAVSNHYGNMGFGHYTAYAKNPMTETWYEFDDSRVATLNSSMVKETVCTNAAYNLFYRRRDFYEQNKKGLDFDKLAIIPDLAAIAKK